MQSQFKFLEDRANWATRAPSSLVTESDVCASICNRIAGDRVSQHLQPVRRLLDLDHPVLPQQPEPDQLP